MENMKLAIACVYYFEPDDDWILEIQLNQIAKTTKGCDFQLYAAANRLSSEQKKRLQAWPFVTILGLEPTEQRSSREHGHYLDQLIAQAANDGCTHIATFDCDSFPITDGWAHQLVKQLGDSYRFAAVFREENHDTFLPHPCGYFMEAAFFTDHRPQLFPPSEMLDNNQYQAFFETTKQRIDTGIGYAMALWQSNEEWLKLSRSNAVNHHWLMAGIYGDLVFHLGAGSRTPAFFRDSRENFLLNFSRKVKKFPLMWRLEGFLTDRYVRRIKTIQNVINEKLKNDPQGLFDELRGH